MVPDRSTHRHPPFSCGLVLFYRYSSLGKYLLRACVQQALCWAGQEKKTTRKSVRK